MNRKIYRVVGILLGFFAATGIMAIIVDSINWSQLDTWFKLWLGFVLVCVTLGFFIVTGILLGFLEVYDDWDESGCR